ncbi:MAG: hypothetical protein ACW98D_20625 [Promethearchaeota archaeon]
MTIKNEVADKFSFRERIEAHHIVPSHSICWYAGLLSNNSKDFNYSLNHI